MSKATHVVIDGVSYPLDDTTAVDFSEAQSLSDAEKQQARTNIGAGSVSDVSDLKNDLMELQEGGYVADAQQIQEKVDNYLDEHPEATTTVQDGSLTFAKFASSLKEAVIPQLSDFGTTSITLLNTVLQSGVPFLRLSGEYTSSTPIVIEKPVTLICDGFTFHQTVWGNPGIIVLSDNVNILGDVTLICDVTTRNPVTNSYYPDDVDKKADSTGIMLGHGSTFKNFYAQNVIVKNFIAGITNFSVGFSNVNIDYLYVENVDFGLFGAYFNGAYVKNLEFKDITSYVGSTDPSHAVYLTGGTSVGLSKNVVIESIIGDGCESKDTDTVLSVKSTINFACNRGYVKNIAGLCSVITSTGYVENIIADVANSGVSCQGADTDFTYKNIVINDISVSDRYVNYFTTDAKGTVLRCTFNVISDDADYAYVYVSGTVVYTEKDCIYTSPANSTAKLYNREGANSYFTVLNPTASIELFTGNADAAKAYTLLDPRKLNFPKTNCLVPNPHFVENDYIASEPNASRHYPVGFRTNDKVSVTNGSVQYFNTNNYTNGVVFTLFNGGNTDIVYGNRIVTKTGSSYLSANWKVFRFINIGDVAYEI